MDIKKQFEEGLLSKNPVLVQLLGMCSTLAITTSMFNGIGMGLSVTKDGGTMDAITGATITSRAICVGINAALDVVAGLG